jgi:hypothetical protein
MLYLCTQTSLNQENPAKTFTLRTHIQGDSRLADITAGGDFLGPCDQKRSYKRVSDFGWLRSYDRLKLRIEGNDF